MPDLIELLRQVRLVSDADCAAVDAADQLPIKDRPIVAAAVAAAATHLVTGDKQHFGPLFGQVIEGVMVLPPGEYLRRRGND
jgi:hypothetical protein